MLSPRSELGIRSERASTLQVSASASRSVDLSPDSACATRLQTPDSYTAHGCVLGCELRACLRRLCGRVIKFSGMPKTQFEVIKWQLLLLLLLSLIVMMECVKDDETTKLRFKNFPPSPNLVLMSCPSFVQYSIDSSIKVHFIYVFKQVRFYLYYFYYF